MMLGMEATMNTAVMSAELAEAINAASLLSDTSNGWAIAADWCERQRKTEGFVEACNFAEMIERLVCPVDVADVGSVRARDGASGDERMRRWRFWANVHYEMLCRHRQRLDEANAS